MSRPLTKEMQTQIKNYVLNSTALDPKIAGFIGVVQRNVRSVLLSELSNPKIAAILTAMYLRGWISEDDKTYIEYKIQETRLLEFDVNPTPTYETVSTAVADCYVKICRKDIPYWVHLTKGVSQDDSRDHSLAGIITSDVEDLGRVIFFEEKHVFEVDLLC